MTGLILTGTIRVVKSYYRTNAKDGSLKAYSNDFRRDRVVQALEVVFRNVIGSVKGTARSSS